MIDGRWVEWLIWCRDCHDVHPLAFGTCDQRKDRGWASVVELARRWSQ